MTEMRHYNKLLIFNITQLLSKFIHSFFYLFSATHKDSKSLLREDSVYDAWSLDGHII